LLRDKQLPPEKHDQYIEYILKAIGRGSTVVKQVLTFARRDEIAPSSIQINDVVMEVSKMLQETIPRIIGISIALDEIIPLASIDGDQFHQALLNLCVNARDAIFDTPQGEQTTGTITITTGSVDGETLRKQYGGAVADKYVFLSVADTGKGMDAEIQKRIFDPFFTTKERGKGTGLGLAVVYGIVAAHGGFLDVLNEVNNGSTFTMYLPVSIRDLKIGRHPAGAPDVPLRGAETILLIEDEEPLLNLMKLFLESNGYTVLTATDGLMAIDVYTHHADDISLVLTDVGLPYLGGISVIQRLRKLNPSLPALLASGYLTEHQQRDAQQLGVEKIIAKPYQPNNVLARIREALAVGM